MTPRSFWMIIIRIMGIYLILESIYVLVPFITGTFYIIKEDNGYPVFQLVLGFLVVAGAYFLLLRYCIFRTEFLVDKLKLDQGFIEEKFEINIHRSTTLKIAIIVMGGVMFIEILPVVCREFLSFIQSSGPQSYLRENQKTGWLIYDFVKLLISLFMMTSSRLIVNFVERKRKDNPVVSDAQ